MRTDQKVWSCHVVFSRFLLNMAAFFACSVLIDFLSFYATLKSGSQYLGHMNEFYGFLFTLGNARHMHQTTAVGACNKLGTCGHVSTNLILSHAYRDCRFFNREHPSEATTLVFTLRFFYSDVLTTWGKLPGKEVILSTSCRNSTMSIIFFEDRHSCSPFSKRG